MSKEVYISDEDFLEKTSNKINGILLERCLHLLQKYPQLTFVVGLLVASNSITQHIKCNKLNREMKNLKDELKQFRLAIAKQDERRVDLMEGLQKQDEAREREVKSLQDALELQNDARQKEMKDLQHAIKLQNDARQEKMKDLQQAMSSQNELRQKESMEKIETMDRISDRISDQMRLMHDELMKLRSGQQSFP